MLVIEAIFFFERKVKIDDPVGAVSVHGVCGVWGVLCVGLFADGSYGGGWNLTKSALTDGRGVTGLFYDWELGIRQFGAQAAGAVVIATVMFGFALAFFKIPNRLTKGGIRPSAEDEMAGLDLPEMGVLAYTSFAVGPSANSLAPSEPSPAFVQPAETREEPVETGPDEGT